MPVPDLSNIRVLIADERAEVRDLLSTTLRGLGVTNIDTVAAGIAGTNVVALMTRNAMPPTDGAGGPPAETIADLVTRFSHDVASPLMGVLALTELLIQEGQLGKPAEEDLRNIRSAAEEIAGMVRALSERVAVGRTSHPPNAS